MEFSIYPNPSYGDLYLNVMHIKSDVYITLYNDVGQELLSETYPSSVGTISDAYDISRYPKGIYIVKLAMNDEIYVRKIILLDH